jgi:hypothetical protein
VPHVDKLHQVEERVTSNDGFDLSGGCGSIMIADDEGRRDADSFPSRTHNQIRCDTAWLDEPVQKRDDAQGMTPRHRHFDVEKFITQSVGVFDEDSPPKPACPLPGGIPDHAANNAT